MMVGGCMPLSLAVMNTYSYAGVEVSEESNPKG